MRIQHLLYFAGIIIITYLSSITISGCAQIGMPTGGPRDSVAPVLVTANPPLNSINFTGNKIELTFDEYVDVKEAQTNVLVSPYPKSNPTVSFKLKTITVKLKDTLKANTTYAINFGRAIQDNNEGNAYKDFTYVFSTGSTIDSLKLKGKVILAESGKTDSTLVAILYRDAPDSAVQTRKPDYLAKIDREGNFYFTNLSAGNYKLYALKDGDGGKTYNSAIEQFAFNDNDIVLKGDSTPLVTMYAFAEEKDTKKPGSSSQNNTAKADKKLKFTNTLSSGSQSLLTPLTLTFSKPLKTVDDKKIILTDTNYKKIDDPVISMDTTGTIMSISAKWTEDFNYRLLIDSNAVQDSLGNHLAKNDTILFKAKKESDYGNLVIRFSNYEPAKHPVIQFFKGEDMIKSASITTTQWSDKLFEPGEYEIRILFDDNNNGKWDPGNYKQKKQPEKVITLDKKITVKANWDNEKEVGL